MRKPSTIAVMVVHGVQGTGLDLVNPTALQLLHHSLALDAVAGLHMALSD